MIKTRLDRLRRLTGFQVPEGNDFTDTNDERENLVVFLVRALGNHDAADKLQHLINTHRKSIREWKYSADEKRTAIEDHRSFFAKTCCQIINRELATGPEAFVQRDFLSHRFWIIVDSCLVEIGLRRLKDQPVDDRLGASFQPEVPLEARIASYTATRPTLRFPVFKNLSDIEQNLLEDVLKDQRGLKRKPELFSQHNVTMYDRRYVAALRAQLNAAENLARDRLTTIKSLEKRLESLDSPELSNPTERAMRFHARPINTNERRRVAGELRDLAHELALLPERLSQYMANERKNKAARAAPSKPQFFEDIVLLSRGVSYDLTTLDLVDAGLAELNLSI